MIDANRMPLLIALALPVMALAARALADRGRPDIMIADLRKTPLPAQWTVEGYAFGTRKPGSWRQQAARQRLRGDAAIRRPRRRPLSSPS